MKKISAALTFSLATIATGFLVGACGDTSTPNVTATNGSSATPAANSTTTSSAKGLKIGSLLPTTGDLASVGQQMLGSVPLLVDTVNGCGGVNGEPVTLVQVDDQTIPKLVLLV